ncbi:MAG: DNA-binding NarL/FixJ family response regulator [Cyclobacteriaceae bacterium]|jgi:DNA-binding NarL/FixJ family response regulator
MNVLSSVRNRTATQAMRIFLTDDHAILLEGLVKIITSREGLEVIGTAASVQSTIDQLSQLKVDLLITDYNLPDGDGLGLVQRVKRKYPDIKIIVLSMYDESHLVKEILKEGVSGYVLKKDSHIELLNAIEAVGNDKIFLSNEINSMLLQNLKGGQETKLLTDREREILKLIAREFTNRGIAEELFISERTVETHRKNILRKTGTHNLVGLIKFAYANNLI